MDDSCLSSYVGKQESVRTIQSASALEAPIDYYMRYFTVTNENGQTRYKLGDLKDFQYPEDEEILQLLPKTNLDHDYETYGLDSPFYNQHVTSFENNTEYIAPTKKSSTTTFEITNRSAVITSFEVTSETDQMVGIGYTGPSLMFPIKRGTHTYTINLPLCLLCYTTINLTFQNDVSNLVFNYIYFPIDVIKFLLGQEVITQLGLICRGNLVEYYYDLDPGNIIM
uniref:Uncharacterized protein n=1 Tax=viral metagenome TaxID=1070528 RepID=A0A6C0JTG0_9ZZZZ